MYCLLDKLIVQIHGAPSDFQVLRLRTDAERQREAGQGWIGGSAQPYQMRRLEDVTSEFGTICMRDGNSWRKRYCSFLSIPVEINIRQDHADLEYGSGGDEDTNCTLAASPLPRLLTNKPKVRYLGTRRYLP